MNLAQQEKFKVIVAMRSGIHPYPELSHALYSYFMQMEDMSFMRKALLNFLRTFFNHLYTSLAWAYDLVAQISSVGQWYSWQRTGMEALPAGRVLEIGYGTGHMLAALSMEGFNVIGIDPSKQMSRITSRRLRKSDFPYCLSRAKAQALPFPAESFASILSTFPSEYVFDEDTFLEAWRVLKHNGVFVIILGVVRIIGWKNGRRNPLSFLDELASLVYRLTGEAIENGTNWRVELKEKLRDMDFSTEIELVRLNRAQVLRIVAKKLPRENS